MRFIGSPESLWWPARSGPRESGDRSARPDRRKTWPERGEFHRQREQLEARFLTRAAAGGKPPRAALVGLRLRRRRDLRPRSPQQAALGIRRRDDQLRGDRRGRNGGKRERPQPPARRPPSSTTTKAAGAPTVGRSSISIRPKRSNSTRPIWSWSLRNWLGRSARARCRSNSSRTAPPHRPLISPPAYLAAGFLKSI